MTAESPTRADDMAMIEDVVRLAFSYQAAVRAVADIDSQLAKARLRLSDRMDAMRKDTP